MSYLWLALKDLSIVARDRKAILTLVLMPLLLIAILGAAFGNLMDDGEENAIQKFTLGIVNKDQGTFGKILEEQGFKKAMSKQIAVKHYREEDMLESIKDEKLAVGIVINPDFSASVFEGKKAKVVLYKGANPGIKAMIVDNVIMQFTQYITVEAVAAQLAPSKQNNPEQPPSIENLPVQGQNAQAPLHEMTINAKTKTVNSFQYYAAGMGVMFLLMTVVEGVSAMILEKEQEVYKRLLITNLTYAQYLSGKMLGLVAVCLVQATIMIAGTWLLYGVDWGQSLSGIVILTFSYVISACGLGVLAGSIFKTEKSFGAAGLLGSQIMAAIGGSMASLYLFPDWMVSLVKILPNGLALQSYLDLMTGASLSQLLPSAGILLGLGAVFFLLGLLRMTMTRRRQYA